MTTIHDTTNFINTHHVEDAMIDINDLRRKVNSTDIVDHIDLHANIKPFLSELLDRLEAAEKAVTEAYQRGYATGQEEIEKELAELRSSMKFRTSLIGRTEAERDALRAALQHEADCVEACKSEIDRLRAENAGLVDDMNLLRDNNTSLRAKIAEMEQQEPAGEVVHNGESAGLYDILKQGTLLYALPGAQQCKNCNGMGSRFDPSGEKIPCDLCESRLEEIRSLVAEAAHDIISGSDFWLSISLAAKKIYTLPGAKGEEK